MKLIKEQHTRYKIGEFCCNQLQSMFFGDIIDFNNETGQFYIDTLKNEQPYGFIYCPFCGELIE